MRSLRVALPPLLVLLLIAGCGPDAAPPMTSGPQAVDPYPLEGLEPLGTNLYPPDPTQFVVEVELGTDLGAIVDSLEVEPIGIEEFSTHAVVLFGGSSGLMPSSFLGFPGVKSSGANEKVDVFAESGSLVIGFVDWGWEDSSGTGQNAFAGLNLPVVHNMATGAGVRVGVVDTGADLAHPLLASRVEPLPPGTMGSAETCNAQDDDGDGEIDEACSHGTFVCGEIAIVAPDATIVPCRALNSDGVGSVLDVIRGMLHLAEAGCDVINLSLSLSDYHEQFESVLIDLQSRGIAVVAAAGNAGGRNPLFPGTSPYAVGAAAVDVTNTLASFSGGGPLINLGAPGVGVRSAFLGGGTGQASGTSMAAPIISATVALVIEGESMTALDAVTRVLTNTEDINPWTASESGAVDPLHALMSTL